MYLWLSIAACCVATLLYLDAGEPRQAVLFFILGGLGLGIAQRLPAPRGLAK
jgi:hypothetical protein